jgi:hypothetical protein
MRWVNSDYFANASEILSASVYIKISYSFLIPNTCLASGLFLQI